MLERILTEYLGPRIASGLFAFALTYAIAYAVTRLYLQATKRDPWRPGRWL